MKPKVSIIIPVYNVEKYITRCLESIQCQTMHDFEVLIVDDGSSDKTGDICDQFAKKDKRFHVIHKQNEGVSIARNTALDQAIGEYFMFFDGDDYVLPETLEELYNKVIEKQADAVLYGYYLVENNKISEIHLPSFEKEQYLENEIFTQVIPKFIGVSYQDIIDWLNGKKDALKKENTALWRSMVKASVIQNDNLRFDKNLKVGEDTCFTTEYLSNTRNVCVVGKCYYHLVVRETSTIYVYEKDPVSVLKGKLSLLTARRSLTQRIFESKGKDIEKYWYGTVVMSAIQLAFYFNNSKVIKYRKGYSYFMEYIKQEETQKAITNLSIPHQFSLKKIPFVLLKKKYYSILYLAVRFLIKVGYSFER